jgi:hypothetical protein
MKYTRGVLAGKYKGDDLFASVLQAIVLKRDRQERGAGMQNFKYAPDLVEFAHIIHTHSPKAYEFLRGHLPLPDIRTIKYAWLPTVSNELITYLLAFKGLVDLNSQSASQNAHFSWWRSI